MGISSSLASNISASPYIDITLIPNETKLFPIPDHLKFTSLEIIKHTHQQVASELPYSTFYIQFKQPQDAPISEIIYTQSLNHELLKKGQTTYLRLFAPKTYYSNNYKYTTNDINIRLYFDFNPSFFPLYDPQAPDYDYVIITNTSFWSIYNDYYKDWKIDQDSKINSILIVNVSDITSNSTFWVNGTFGDATNTSNGNPWIPDGKEISSSWDLFNDTPAMVRNFLRYCNTTHNTRYVLIGGDKDVVAPRMAASRASGDGCSSFDNDLSHASDMYFACLDYCMNNNTNSYFMENACCSNTYDEVDWGFDLMVGRVLAHNATTTLNWINKTKAYINGYTQGNYLGNYIVACKDSSNAISNQSWTGWDSGNGVLGPGLHDQHPSNVTFLNNMNISQDQWIIMNDYVNGNVSGWDGFHIIYHTGHGGTLYSTEGGCYRPGMCLNTDVIPNFVYTEGCHSADFGTDINSRMERWMEYPACAFAGISNSAYGWFSASTYFSSEMFNQMFNTTTGNLTPTFCEAHNAARELTGHTTADGIWAMIYKETNFFGDPALDYNWYENDTTAPNITINFAGNLSDFGGPYWTPPTESSQLSGTWYDGYYINDSQQYEDWIYINCTATDSESTVHNVWLNWLNDTTWTNWTYPLIKTSNDYWEINTFGNISVSSSYSYSFDIVANSTGGSNTTAWNKTIIGGASTRRYVHLNCQPTNLSYKVFYLLNYTSGTGDPPTYTYSDLNKYDRLHHDQGISDYNNTGYLNSTLPNITLHGRHSLSLISYWFEDDTCIAPFNLTNIYYHVWWSAAGMGGAFIKLGWNKNRQAPSSTFTDSRTINSNYCKSFIWDDYPTPGNGHYMSIGLLETTDTNFTDNSIYDFLFSFYQSDKTPSIICNRSMQSFILLNVPDNTTLQGLDSDSDGLTDYIELYSSYTNPFYSNTDGDNLTDYWEHQSGSDPNNYSDAYNISEGAFHFISINDELNGTLIFDSTPTFNWTISTNASQYWLQISNSPTFTPLIINITNVSNIIYPSYYTSNETTVSFTLPPYYSLPYPNIYYCRIRAQEKT